MSTITPTIGRKVWFWPNSDDFHSMDFIDREQALDATVIYVNVDDTVNLLIVDHVGGMSARRRVPLYQGDVDSRPRGHACATWMPYQREQAKKADTAAVTTEKKAEALKPFEHHYDANMLSSPAMIKELTARGYGVTNEDTPDPCLAKRKPGEPMFTLLGRDPFGASLVRLWAAAREAYALKNTPPERIEDARRIAREMAEWCMFDAGRAIAAVLDYLPFNALSDAMQRRGATVTTAPHGGDGEQSRTCSDERPCVPCYADQGACLGPAKTGMERRGSSLRPAADDDRWFGIHAHSKNLIRLRVDLRAAGSYDISVDPDATPPTWHFERVN